MPKNLETSHKEIYNKKLQLTILEHFYYHQYKISCGSLFAHIKKHIVDIEDKEIYANLNYLVDFGFVVELPNGEYRIHVNGANAIRCNVKPPGLKPLESTF